MKTKNILLFTSVLLAFRFVPVVAAQDAAPTATPAVTQTPAPGPGPRGMFSPEEREKLKAAREKAMQDPKVKTAQENMKAANEVFAAARKQALLAQDPSLGPVLDKLETAMKQNPPGPQGAGAQAGPPGRGGRRMEAALNSLTPEERQKFQAANQKIKDNPDVVSAREKKMQADKQFAAAMHDAMLAADPTLEPLLKKMEEARQQRQSRNQDSPPPATPTPTP
jgi:spore coat protein CotF